MVFSLGCTEKSFQTTASDLVQISPEDVEKPGGESIEDNINAKYANKVNGLLWKPRAAMLTTFQVIQKIGLCICVYDVLSASDGLIGHGTGIVNVNGVSEDLGLQRPYVKDFQSNFVLSSSALSKERLF